MSAGGSCGMGTARRGPRARAAAVAAPAVAAAARRVSTSHVTSSVVVALYVWVGDDGCLIDRPHARTTAPAAGAGASGGAVGGVRLGPPSATNEEEALAQAKAYRKVRRERRETRVDLDWVCTGWTHR